MVKNINCLGVAYYVKLNDNTFIIVKNNNYINKNLYSGLCNNNDKELKISIDFYKDKRLIYELGNNLYLIPIITKDKILSQYVLKNPYICKINIFKYIDKLCELIKYKSMIPIQYDAYINGDIIYSIYFEKEKELILDNYVK